MNEYLLDPNVCPSSLGQNDEPIDINETAHRWDTDADPITCAECGTEYDKEVHTHIEQKCICAGCGNEHLTPVDN